MKKVKKVELLVKELDKMRRKSERIEQCKYELENIQKKYDKLLESSPDAMLFVTRESKIVFVNVQFERLFGYSEAEVVGKDLEMLIPERFRFMHHENVAKFFANPRVRPMSVGLSIYGLKKDGTQFPADISLNPLQTDGDLMVTAAVRDITERKRAEDIIERNYHIQRVISSILKIALEPIPLSDQMDQVLELIFTMPGLALQSKGFIYLVEEDTQVLVLKAPRSFPESPQPPCEKVVMGKCMCSLGESMCSTLFLDCAAEWHKIGYQDGFPHGHYCVPIASTVKLLGIINLYVERGHKRSPEEEEFLTAVANTLAGVIERQNADLEKQKLQQQLAQAEKFSALGRITANVADEIRNPLTAVGGFARRLHKVVHEGPEQEYTSSIISEVNRLETILHDVLIFSHTGGNHREEQDIGAIINEVLSLHQEMCRQQFVAIHKEYGDVPRVMIEKNQVHEAIKQLLINAMDAMPNGGTLSIITKKDMVKGIPYAAISVEDTGVGIPVDKLDMIFEPFFTTKIRPKGTGLGLSIVKKIVEDHGGFIHAENRDAKGSAFTFY
ncbi:MAG: PAS domain S-box protein, partial [Dissulfurispiraceae bacterium]